MKTKFYTAAIVLVLLCLFTNCQKEAESLNKFENETVLFQYEYTNQAWIDTHSGWFVDASGNIKGYDKSDEFESGLTSNWKYTDSQGFISRQDLFYNYEQADSLIGNIDTTILSEKAKLIPHTIDGEITSYDIYIEDIGLMCLYCYQWDETKQKYKRQVLQVSGGYIQTNTAAAAIELTTYLNQLIDNKPCKTF